MSDYNTSPDKSYRTSQAPSGRYLFGLHTRSHKFVHMLRTSMDSCELVLEEVYCYMFLLLQQCGLILVNFMYYRISAF